MRLFLSATSDPYRNLRQEFGVALRKAGFKVVLQEEFVETGTGTLIKLAEFIEHETDIVLHLVGHNVGSVPTEDELQALLEHCGAENLAQRFPKLFKGGRLRKVTYTQWEAWLAWFYDKRVFLLEAEDIAPADGAGASSATAMPASQHLELIQGRCGWSTKFSDKNSLLREILMSLARILNRVPQGGDRPFNLPYTSIDNLFVGRDAFLKELYDQYGTARTSGKSLVQVVCGVGGLGKTRVAVEYAYRYGQTYSAVLMINGDSPESLRSSLAQSAIVLEPNLDPGMTDDIREQRTLTWLRSNPGWLLIIDNADTKEARGAVVSRLPRWTNGHVLVTARFQAWPKPVCVHDLHVLNEADGADFLLRATAQRQKSDDEKEQARQLAGADLDGLCLALEQAAAYINERAISLAEYRVRWAKNQKQARTWADNVLMQYHPDRKEAISVATTWLTTFDELSQEARTLVQMCAWMAPDPIPRGLVEGDGFVKHWQILAGNDSAEIELALAELRTYSFLSRASDTSAGQIHRVVQLITRDRLEKSERRATLQAILDAIDEYTPTETEDVRTWPIMEPL